MDFVRGDATGLEIPAHAEALRAGSASLLTRAFQAFGVLSAGNRVTRITRCESSPGGSTGHKLLLTVEYAALEPGLHTDLFVKFSRDFTDVVRDERGKYEMEPEVHLAAISHSPAFPIHVPRVYFADYHRASHTGLIISRRIAFGADGIEPHRAKCLDHEIADPLPYYRTIVKALARIAAAHKSGRLGPEVATVFPYDPAAAAAASPIPYDARQLRDLVRQYAEFATQCPQLLPAGITSAEFIAKLDRDAVRLLEHQMPIKRFLQSNPDLIALCHWNAQIDNAWFWRDSSGELECGLMDWGHVGQMNIAFSLWGSLSGTVLGIWERHLEDLLRVFTDEFQRHGGPRIDAEELKLHLLLYAAMMALSYFFASPSRILSRLPEAAHASGPQDPIFRKSEPARNNLHILSVVFSLWHTHDFGALLDRLPSRSAIPAR
jgi:hypothetical protein